MISYYFKCSECGSIEEISLTRFIESLELSCPTCQRVTEFHYKPTLGGFILNGTGFYKTDYSKNKQ